MIIRETVWRGRVFQTKEVILVENKIIVISSSLLVNSNCKEEGYLPLPRIQVGGWW